MGKLKTKYPIDIAIQFILFLENNDCITETYGLKLETGNLLYSHLSMKFQQFLANNDIKYEAYMFYLPLNEDQQTLVHIQWVLNINQIEQKGRHIMIRVKSSTQHIKELIYEELEQLQNRIKTLEQRVRDPIQHNEENQPQISVQAPTLHHANSILPVLPDKDLDIGILFSEPIVDENGKEASFPVDFRSQIQRLYSALNNSYKPQITVECQIGTKQHLKHLIGIKKPKILHIICHGTKQGELQFQDDSKFSIGLLNCIDKAKIRQILLSQKESIPKLVFINSCHSEIIGNIFYEVGAKYVIMIDSQDKIDDEAAQIFSQNFYRNIFRGEKVGFSFKQAKDTVGMKHNSLGCCCRHTHRQKHRPECRWLKIVQEIGQQEAHQLYHLPSDKCACPLRNHNRHSLLCQWARFSLFHINKDFRIKTPTGEEIFPKTIPQLPAYLPYQKKELVICCCFNFQGQNKQPRIPHSQSNKFKMLPANDQDTEPLYVLQKNVNFRTQIIDYTAPELTQYYEKVQNNAVLGRQQELYEFMKKIKDQKLFLFFLYGYSGIGKTSFAIKTATYLIERRVYQIYFFIDLYNIKDRDMFRNKFNQVTQLGYPNNRASLNEVRNKPMIIILDNCDEFSLQSGIDFQQEILNLRKQFIHTKILMTFQVKNLPALENSKIMTHHETFKKQLKFLNQNVAAKALFSKIKNYLDITVNFLEIRRLIQQKKQLQIPKVIENLSHTFSNMKKKIKIEDLKMKIEQYEEGKGNLMFHKLVGDNLKILKGKCPESYQMLIFISQFSQGIDSRDFIILSMYDKTNHLMNRQNEATIDIPIDRHWQKRLAILFQRYKEIQASEITKDSEGEQSSTSPLFQKHVSYAAQKKKPEQTVSNVKDFVQNTPLFKGQSYFLQQLSNNRFIVKRFIRDFIWNKDSSDENYYMKHIFVAYTCVMLDIYLKFLVDQYYVHEELIEYTDISKGGVFKYKDNNYTTFSLTQSLRYAEDYNTKFEKILKEQDTLNDKIKSSDPSVFILNHKLDFLHIYGYDWIKVYDYLIVNRKKQANVFITYLQKLIILIPTALKIANVEESLLQYSIRQSIQLHSQIRNYSKPGHNLMLTIKLKLLKAGSEIIRNPADQSIIPNIQFQKHFHKNDLQKINPQLLNTMQQMFRLEIQVLQIYREYQMVKDMKKSVEMISRNLSQIILQAMKKLQLWINSQEDWTTYEACEVLHAKKHLLMVMTYNKLLQVPGKHMANMNIVAFKNKYAALFIQFASQSAGIFSSCKMMKLALRAKLLELNLTWQGGKQRIKSNQITKQAENVKNILKEVQEIYENKTYNLIGLTFFQSLIKKIKKQMKQKIWQQSINSLIFMKAVPLSHKNSPLIHNIVRKHSSVKDQFRSMFKASQIDLSIKFQMLSCEKLEEEAKKSPTILLLYADAKIFTQKDANDRIIQNRTKVYLLLEGNDLRENEIQINSQFLRKFPIYNTKLLILIGNNVHQAAKRITQLLQSKNSGPSIISISSSSSIEFDQFEQCTNIEEFISSNNTQLKKLIEHFNKLYFLETQIGKYLIKGLLSVRNYKKSLKDIFYELHNQLGQQLKQVRVQFYQNGRQIIKLIKGTFKDLSPGHRHNHNINLEFKPNDSIVYKKWKEINLVFKQLANNNKQPKYFHLCGGSSVGKTTFINELGRMFVERGMFEQGLYIIDGKQVEQKHQSDFELYIIKKNESSNIFNLQVFNKYANQNFLLIIDDFHLIKPKSNGRYNLFMKRLLEKRINLMLVTHETYNPIQLKDIYQSVSFKTIKLQKMTDMDLNIYAYNLFNLNNQALIQEYLNDKQHKKMTLIEIKKLNEKYKIMQKNSNLLISFQTDPLQENLKKIISNRN